MSLFVYSINPETELIWRTYGTEWNASFRIWLIELTIFTEYVPSKMPVDWDLFTGDTGRQCRTYQDTSNNHVARCFSWPCHPVSHHSAWRCFLSDVQTATERVSWCVTAQAPPHTREHGLTPRQGHWGTSSAMQPHTRVTRAVSVKLRTMFVIWHKMYQSRFCLYQYLHQYCLCFYEENLNWPKAFFYYFTFVHLVSLNVVYHTLDRTHILHTTRLF